MVRRSDAARPVVLYRPYELLITQEDFAHHRLFHVSAQSRERRRRRPLRARRERPRRCAAEQRDEIASM